MDLYLIVVVILFALAISDLIVGVSNDAVNFLNSAIGSRVASIKVIMIIASVGVLVGTTFSSGMMEVARRGIFHPDQFVFAEIMAIFLAVMLTDIILLDLFNTFGLPTSTTVSIVFELLGAAVAISLIKISQNNDTIIELNKYINTDKAFAIISGIFLSIAVAFSIGAIVQYLSRIAFSFRYEKSLRYFGGIWGGIAITGITYFMLIKGAKGSSFISEETLAWIKDNNLWILLYSFIGWTAILQLCNWLFKFNILKFIVLVGTFALAMAFAGNDLVNFVGVPLAGYKSYDAFVSSGATDPSLMPMTVLNESVKSNTYVLLLAGVIMILTLWFSKKAKKVVKTSIDLSRQDEGEERFNSSSLARALVRMFVTLGHYTKKIVPKGLSKAIQKRFDKPADPLATKRNRDLPAFDLIRASINLVVASMLIALGTSLQLPLSTTYVTFMVAMGTSLADKAWGRESAVYRITGVLTVIGGWFLTALIAFVVAFTFALCISYGGSIAILVLVLLAAFLVIRSYLYHKRKEKENKLKASIDDDIVDIETKLLIEKTSANIAHILEDVNNIYGKTLINLADEKRGQLKKLSKKVREHYTQTAYLKSKINKVLNKLKDGSVSNDYLYVLVIDYLREVSHCIKYITIPAFQHVDNNHKGLVESQIEELVKLSGKVGVMLKKISQLIADKEINQLGEVEEMGSDLVSYIEQVKKNQISRIRNKEVGAKNSVLFLNILSETKNLAFHSTYLHKVFIQFVKQ